MKKSNTQIQADYRKRMKADGFRQITVYVHDDDRKQLKDYAERLKLERLANDYED